MTQCDAYSDPFGAVGLPCNAPNPCGVARTHAQNTACRAAVAPASGLAAIWALASAVFMAASVSAGEAKAALHDVPEIETPLFAVAVAIEVAKTCDRLQPRKLRGLRELYRIRSTARDLGYSDGQIRDYIKSDQEKARMRAKGERLLQQAGVKLDEPDSFCAYGIAEIEKHSAIGVLLRVK